MLRHCHSVERATRKLIVCLKITGLSSVGYRQWGIFNGVSSMVFGNAQWRISNGECSVKNVQWAIDENLQWRCTRQVHCEGIVKAFWWCIPRVHSDDSAMIRTGLHNRMAFGSTALNFGVALNFVAFRSPGDSSCIFTSRMFMNIQCTDECSKLELLTLLDQQVVAGSTWRTSIQWSPLEVHTAVLHSDVRISRVITPFVPFESVPSMNFIPLERALLPTSLTQSSWMPLDVAWSCLCDELRIKRTQFRWSFFILWGDSKVFASWFNFRDFHWISTTSRAESDRSPLAPAGRIFGHLLKLYVSVKMLESNASVKWFDYLLLAICFDYPLRPYASTILFDHMLRSPSDASIILSIYSVKFLSYMSYMPISWGCNWEACCKLA